MSNPERGFSILEVLLAVAIFVAFASASVGAVVTGFNLNRLGTEKTVANQFTAEGMEAVKSIKNRAFTNLSTLAAAYCTTGAGLAISGGVWILDPANGIPDILTHNATDDYERIVKVCPVLRNIAGSTGNIVESGGVIDGNTYKVTVTTTWNFNSSRPESVALTQYFTNFRDQKGGLLVYGNGGTTSDAIQYKIYDAETDTWSAPASTVDIDSSSTNRALRAVRVYASNGRNEKIAVSRHYNGTTQSIYAQVFNGSTWGSVVQFSTWNASTFLDVLNFDGTYLSNGDFMVVYSDNSITPKYSVWNGSSWGSQASMNSLGSSQIPNYVVAAARPGTNEVMAAFFTSGNDTKTQYYSGTSWSSVTTHATNAPSNTKRFSDFTWSQNTNTTGAIVYATSGTDRRQTVKLFVANGTGGGSWGPARNGATQANVLGSINVEASPTTNEFVSCDKDGAATPTIVCREIIFTGNDPTISTPTNPIIASSTDNGIQRSFDQKYESVSGTMGVIVYADNTTTPKLKKYNPSTATWDSSATSISMSGFTPGVFRMIRMTRQDTGDDMLVLMGDANLDVYSVFWDGTNNATYTTPVVKAVNQHGLTGAVTTDYWFDFAWDNF